ncbi:hypothetical protein ACRE_043110 [Hapsidospora chrysogenum ATCC 11550]|uniref:Uncharacterized protein n=1 Tax=Hapsidospora chrysogenum (strain ATCC 11550 / CBS 779.69 / DSM 880 / IAM 14645 / JCM 23072 / IMI 49137) TaxID=857340 RepID=A0A086T677_HAPC1|nr:hypothetical protein ACRE_043110 [Hapsidospora chrysogenum ATCC 11550]
MAQDSETDRPSSMILEPEGTSKDTPPTKPADTAEDDADEESPDGRKESTSCGAAGEKRTKVRNRQQESRKTARRSPKNPAARGATPREATAPKPARQRNRQWRSRRTRGNETETPPTGTKKKSCQQGRDTANGNQEVVVLERCSQTRTGDRPETKAKQR